MDLRSGRWPDVIQLPQEPLLLEVNSSQDLGIEDFLIAKKCRRND
jgi:hypothetical protein